MEQMPQGAVPLPAPAAPGHLDRFSTGRLVLNLENIDESTKQHLRKVSSAINSYLNEARLAFPSHWGPDPRKARMALARQEIKRRLDGDKASVESTNVFYGPHPAAGNEVACSQTLGFDAF